MTTVTSSSRNKELKHARHVAPPHSLPPSRKGWRYHGGITNTTEMLRHWVTIFFVLQIFKMQNDISVDIFVIPDMFKKKIQECKSFHVFFFLNLLRRRHRRRRRLWRIERFFSVFYPPTYHHHHHPMIHHNINHQWTVCKLQFNFVFFHACASACVRACVCVRARTCRQYAYLLSL